MSTRANTGEDYAVNSSSDETDTFNACRYTFGIPEIERYMHNYRKSIPETRERQRRVLRKWNLKREEMHRRTTWPLDLINTWQLERISALVDFAFSTIPFYRQLYGSCGFRVGDIVTWADFDSLPIISRDKLQTNFATVHLPGLDPERCYGARTSGSTGVPLSIVRDDAREELWTMHRMRQFEIMMGEWLQPDNWIYNIYLSTWAFTSLEGAYPVFSISEDCPAETILRHIKLIRPRVISAFPSFLGRLARYGEDLSQYGVRCICTNSESSSPKERQVFADQFGVSVLDEYSTEELGLVASECVYGRYHVIEDEVRVDVEHVAEDGLGDIIGTDLSNLYMPIIRYRQGDLIRFGENALCECGNNFRYLEGFLGRADQALTSPSIGRVPPDRVMNLCDRTFVSYRSGVTEFRVIQKAIDQVEVIIVLRAGEEVADHQTVASFCSGLREIFQASINIDVVYRDSLPNMSSHKRRMIINEMTEIGSDSAS